MHIDLYPAHREAKHDPHAAEDFLDLLRQQGFQPTKSLAEGSLLCDLSEQPWESFLEAIRHWQAQRPGRQVEPNEGQLRDRQGKDPNVAVTVHPPTEAQAATSPA